MQLVRSLRNGTFDPKNDSTPLNHFLEASEVELECAEGFRQFATGCTAIAGTYRPVTCDHKRTLPLLVVSTRSAFAG